MVFSVFKAYGQGMRSPITRITRALAAVALLGLSVAACGSPAPAQVHGAAPDQVSAELLAKHQPKTPLRGGERFLALGMAKPYTPVPPSGGTDEYRCFVIDPKLTQPAYLIGSEFLPQNAAIVHHAIFFRIDAADVDLAKATDDKDPGDGWTCFGGTGIKQSTGSPLGGEWIGSWAPGVSENLVSEHSGYKLEAGSEIVMQVHYNLLASGGKAAGTDQSGMRLRLVDGTAKIEQLKTTLLAAPVELPCTTAEAGPLCDRQTAVTDVGARFGAEAKSFVSNLQLLCGRGQPTPAGVTQHCDQKVRQAGTVYAVGGHMHLLGRSVSVELNPGTPEGQVLLDVPIYNFDDQGARNLAKPVTVKPGDTLRVTCTHDAALRSMLPALKPLPPRYVVWGDGTSDEMCLGIVIWTPPV
jgi:hypothetical protein